MFLSLLSTGIGEQLLKVPVETITGVGFGGPNLDVMFVFSGTNVQDFTQPPADSYPLAPSPLRGQVLMITGLGIKGSGPGTKITRYL